MCEDFYGEPNGPNDNEKYFDFLSCVRCGVSIHQSRGTRDKDSDLFYCKICYIDRNSNFGEDQKATFPYDDKFPSEQDLE